MTLEAYRRGDWRAVIEAHAPDSSNPADWLRYGVALMNTSAESIDTIDSSPIAEAFRKARQRGASAEDVAAFLRQVTQLALAESLLLVGLVDEGLSVAQSGLSEGAKGGDSKARAQLLVSAQLARDGAWKEAEALHSAAVRAVLPQDLTSEQLHAQLNILRTETELLSHELSLAMAHGSLAPSPHEASQGTNPVQTSGSHDSVAEMQRWQSLSRSQLGQDLWVLEQLGWKRGGYFVEFGATDGVLLSNTWLLEKHFDWHGICAEPNPAFFERLERNRRCELSRACIFRTSGEQFSFVLADAYGGILEFAKDDSHLDKREAYASVGSVMEVTTTSLMDLLDQKQAPQQIDYLSIDTEGSELAVLEGIDWDLYAFRCITVEHNYTAQREEIAALLKGQGYERQEAQWDDWYMKSSD